MVSLLLRETRGRFYRIDIQYEAKLRLDAPGIIKKHSAQRIFENQITIERCKNKDTALLDRLRCSLALMPTPRLASLAPCLFIYAALNHAVAAGATRMNVELLESSLGFDLIFRNNGCGMSECQIQQLGLGFSTKSGSGHGQGFRIILELSAEIGAIVRTLSRSVD
jgi:hypothetical protein